MDGLEISELKLSEVWKENDTFRLDSDFFQKEFLAIDFAALGFERLDTISIIRSGTTPAERDDNLKSGVILLKTDNIRNNVLTASELDDFFYIDQVTDARMRATRLRDNDVLINIVGATTDVIGRVSLVPEGFPAANITQAMALLRITNHRVSPYLLFSFLTSKFGNHQVRRLARPTGQYNLNHGEVASLRVPNFGGRFQMAIKQLVKNGYARIVKSNKLFSRAEKFLLDELELTKWKPNEDLNTAILMINDSFGRSDRLDAESYDPKYRQLEEILQRADAVQLTEVLRVNPERGVQPEFVENGPVFVVASKAVRPTGVVLNENERTNETFYHSRKTAKSRLQKGDVLINGTGRGTLGRASIYDSDGLAIADNHVTILRPDPARCDPYYLMLFLNSIAGQMQSERWQCGSSGQLELYPKQIEQFLVYASPKSRPLQKRISQLIRDSFTKRKESQAMLQQAKHAVEIAIEQNEDAAMEFIASSKSQGR